MDRRILIIDSQFQTEGGRARDAFLGPLKPTVKQSVDTVPADGAPPDAVTEFFKETEPREHIGLVVVHWSGISAADRLNRLVRLREMYKPQAPVLVTSGDASYRRGIEAQHLLFWDRTNWMGVARSCNTAEEIIYRVTAYQDGQQKERDTSRLYRALYILSIAAKCGLPERLQPDLPELAELCEMFTRWYPQAAKWSRNPFNNDDEDLYEAMLGAYGVATGKNPNGLADTSDAATQIEKALAWLHDAWCNEGAGPGRNG